MKWFQKFRQIRKIFSNYTPLIEVLIFKDHLQHNLNYFQQKNPALKIAPVLKSNAYGHGLLEVGKILDKAGAAFLIVDSLYEAMRLRKEGIVSEILIIGFVRSSDISANKLKNIAFTITSLEQLLEINSSLKKPTNFHLKIDTGMHRQGILPSQVSQAVEIIKNNKYIVLQGLCSHLADADGVDSNLTLKQIATWNNLVKLFKQAFPGILYFHLSATFGFKYEKQIDANVARLGLGLYGFGVAEDNLNLKPALAVKSIITSIKKIEPGEKVGYNFTFTASKSMTIATVPMGYFEGVDKKLSNIGSHKIGQIFCPLVGKVSMNISTIDVSATSNVQMNDEVTVISSDRADLNSVENIAKLCQTIPYEILVHIAGHLRRTAV